MVKLLELSKSFFVHGRGEFMCKSDKECGCVQQTNSSGEEAVMHNRCHCLSPCTTFSHVIVTDHAKS